MGDRDSNKLGLLLKDHSRRSLCLFLAEIRVAGGEGSRKGIKRKRPTSSGQAPKSAFCAMRREGIRRKQVTSRLDGGHYRLIDVTRKANIVRPTVTLKDEGPISLG
jgi:hypothetical protein